jgi:hypothetical protein
MAKSRGLPPELFDLVPAAFPHIVKVFADCGVTPSELFTLTFIRYNGKNRTPHEKVVLRSVLAEFISTITPQYTSDSGISNFISDLCDRRLLTKMALTLDEKEKWYGDGGGRRDGVALTSKGEETIDEFRAAVNELFRTLTDGIPTVLLPPFQTAVSHLAKSMMIELAKKSGKP